MGKFDISKFAETLRVSDSDTTGGREQIEYIDMDLIDDDPRNFYQLSDLEALASNIALLGLQQPLRVRTNPDAPGRFILVSGHRRRAAIQLLIDDGRADFSQVPCIQDSPSQSSALQELRLIYDNLDTQPYSDAEKSKLASRVEELLYLLKEEGVEFPGRMRDVVAAACKISAPKLARLKVIREKLVLEYMTLFEQDRLPEQTAYALARLPQDFQSRMASVLTEVPSGNTAEKILKKYSEGWRWEPELTCPDGKASKRGDTFLRRDCEAGYWASFCGGKTCCLECEQAKASYSPCERMCSKAKAQRKNEKAEKDAAAYLKRQKIGRKFQKETQGYARRLLRAIDAVGLAENAEIPWRAYCINPCVSEIRQWAAGEFDDPAKWSSAELIPEKLNQSIMVSRLLGCSTDYLVGLTDELRPPEPPMVSKETGAGEDAVEMQQKSGDAAEPRQADSQEDSQQVLDETKQPEPSARLIRWEARNRIPPVGALVITYRQGGNGCGSYQAAVWDGARLLSPSTGDDLSEIQYTQWLEIPIPVTGEAV